MKILLASPFFARHWDSGHFWARAFSNLGHSLILWDFRIQAEVPITTWDIAVVMKGGPGIEEAIQEIHPCPMLLYYPDDPLRHFDNIDYDTNPLPQYEKIFIPCRPTPAYAEWMPTAWDPQIHINAKLEKEIDVLFVGTGTQRKMDYLQAVEQGVTVFGNQWGEQVRPLYLYEYVEIMSKSKISINIHQDKLGINRRTFESAACTFTLHDDIPGIREIFGPISDKILFETPEQLNDMVTYYLSHEEERDSLYQIQRELIEPYTYLSSAQRMLLGWDSI